MDVSRRFREIKAGEGGGQDGVGRQYARGDGEQAPSWKPARRPTRCISSEAGMVVDMMPTNCSASGSVDSIGDGAS